MKHFHIEAFLSITVYHDIHIVYLTGASFVPCHEEEHLKTYSRHVTTV